MMQTIFTTFIICLSFTSASRLLSSQFSAKSDRIDINLASIKQKRALLLESDVSNNYLKLQFKTFTSQTEEGLLYSDFKDFMNSLGISLTAEEIVDELIVFDADCDGIISYEEYIDAIQSYFPEIEFEEAAIFAAVSASVKHEKKAVDAPANDHPCGAQEITTPGVVSASSFNAAPGFFPHCGTAQNPLIAPAVWFKIPGQIKDLTVSTCEGNSDGEAYFDTKISVFGPRCGCFDCNEEASFYCIDGNDDSFQPLYCGWNWHSTVSITGTYCNLYVALHGWGGASGNAEISFEFTPIDSPCPGCVTEIATKGECETCLSWSSYLSTVGCLHFDLNLVNINNIGSRMDDCAAGFICLLDDKPSEILTKSRTDGQIGDIFYTFELDQEFVEPAPTIKTGICVPRNGTSTLVSTCITDQDCSSCMRCCADGNGNKQCVRSSGDICGLEFDGRGPCCCPEYTCKLNECITQSPTPAPTGYPTPAPTGDEASMDEDV